MVHVYVHMYVPWYVRSTRVPVVHVYHGTNYYGIANGSMATPNGTLVGKVRWHVSSSMNKRQPRKFGGSRVLRHDTFVFVLDASDKYL
jgi:hypothetical protein